MQPAHGVEKVISKSLLIAQPVESHRFTFEIVLHEFVFEVFPIGFNSTEVPRWNSHNQKIIGLRLIEFADANVQNSDIASENRKPLHDLFADFLGVTGVCSKKRDQFSLLRDGRCP